MAAPYARTLRDRTVEHQPTPIVGNKPIADFSRYLLRLRSVLDPLSQNLILVAYCHTAIN
jgi:hypothetical protein